MSLPTPTYMTMTEYSVNKGIGNQKTLPAGSFVRPIELSYLPQHIKDSNDYKWFMPSTEIFVYCHFGIVIVPKTLIRRVS